MKFTPGIMATGRRSPNLINNGDFSGTGSWTLNPGWSISGGLARKTPGDTNTMLQLVTFTPGVTYRVTWTLVRNAGSILARLTGGNTVLGAVRSASGTYTDDLTSVAGNLNLAFVPQVNQFDGTIDDVYLERL